MISHQTEQLAQEKVSRQQQKADDAAAAAEAEQLAVAIQQHHHELSASMRIGRSLSNAGNQLDKDYVTFIEGPLTEQCPTLCADFRSVESIIGFLDRISDERLKAKQIAPFNSNLPVLKISTCSSRIVTPTVPAIKAGLLKKTTAAVNMSPVVATLPLAKQNRPSYSAMLKVRESPANSGQKRANTLASSGAISKTNRPSPRNRSSNNEPAETSSRRSAGRNSFRGNGSASSTNNAANNNASRKNSKRERGGRRTTRLKKTISLERFEIDPDADSRQSKAPPTQTANRQTPPPTIAVAEELAIPEPYASAAAAASIVLVGLPVKVPANRADDDETLKQRIERNLNELLADSSYNSSSGELSELSGAENEADGDDGASPMVGVGIRSRHDIFVDNYRKLMEHALDNEWTRRSVEQRRHEMTAIFWRQRLASRVDSLESGVGGAERSEEKQHDMCMGQGGRQLWIDFFSSILFRS